MLQVPKPPSHVAAQTPHAQPAVMPQCALFGWRLPGSTNLTGQPPYALDPQFLPGSREVEATLEGCPWLFPPTSGRAHQPSSTVGPSVAGMNSSLAASASGPRGPVGSSIPEMPYEPPFHYDFTPHVNSEDARGVIRLLLAPSQGPGPSLSFATRFGRAMEQFAVKAYNVVTAVENGRSLIPEEERRALVPEAERAMEALVAGGRVKVATDLVFCLEAFGVSRGRPPQQQQWQCQCLQLVLKKGLAAAPPKDRASWSDAVQSRMLHEASELYGSVDVRAWPTILKLADANFTAIDGEAFRTQVRLQLCMHADTRKRADGLKQAATLTDELRQAGSFGADEIRELFNDREHFEWTQRLHLLATVLRNAPRVVKRAVLSKIDGDDVELGEWDDREINLVCDLLKQLGEDVRCCKHAFFKMKSDWIAGRSSGVIFNEELSPEQLADHIEDEDNHEELLRDAIRCCLKQRRKFEAARLLARPASATTKVFEANRNDKELSYLISLYHEEEKPTDDFSPVEESCLVLPYPSSEILYVEDAGEKLQRLEQETLVRKQPLAIGVWWFWRCFNPRLDLWPRASFLAMAYQGRFVIVDFLRLESTDEASEARGKDVVRQIFEAPHLLKVVHNLEKISLQVLQRALIPHRELIEDVRTPGGGITPMVDLSVVIAAVRRARPTQPVATKLAGIIYDYLRLELCMAEALSNFERRPLRQSQQHYALSLAWSPLMVLHALCAHEVLTRKEMGLLTFRVVLTPAQWEEWIRFMNFCSDASMAENEAAAGLGMKPLPGAHARNLWEDESWRGNLSTPDRTLDLEKHLRMHPLAGLLMPPQMAATAAASLEELFRRGSAARELQRLYKAYEDRQQKPTGPG